MAHRSDGIIVPGIERIIDQNGSVRAPSNVEITLGLELIDAETWVWIGPDVPAHRSTVISVETAHRLHRAVAKLLNESA